MFVGESAGTLYPPLHACPNHVRAREGVVEGGAFLPGPRRRALAYKQAPTPPTQNHTLDIMNSFNVIFKSR